MGRGTLIEILQLPFYCVITDFMILEDTADSHNPLGPVREDNEHFRQKLPNLTEGLP
jgi:hypothetical protein